MIYLCRLIKCCSKLTLMPSQTIQSTEQLSSSVYLALTPHYPSMLCYVVLHLWPMLCFGLMLLPHPNFSLQMILETVMPMTPLIYKSKRRSCGMVNHAGSLVGRVCLRPQKLGGYTPETVGNSLLPAKFLAWNMCHISHIRKI